MRADTPPMDQSDFRGLFSRGRGEVAPDNFFSDCLNNRYSQGVVSTREGLASTPSLTASNIVRAVRYKRLGENPRWVWLDNLGNLYDSLYYPTAIYTDATFTDFSAVTYNNRLYISPHNRVEGIAGKSVLVYEGNGTARLAAGNAPTGYSLTVTESASSGNCEAGIHLVTVCYQTSSGFITAPGQAIAQVTCTGELKISVAGIPISGTTKRILLVTKSIDPDLFNGNLLGYEFFFIPNQGGDVPDGFSNVDLSFYDSDLVESADYLFDNLSTIPAGVAIFVYNNRLGVLGEDGNNYTARLSERNEPEVFNGIDGFVNIDPSDGESGLKNAFEHRRSLILCTGDRFYATSDNDNAPSTWGVTCIEKSAGTEPFGVANVLDTRGMQFDRAFVADRSGLVVFDGAVIKPELTWNVETLWKRINKAKFDLVQVVDDPYTHRLYIAVPLDAATALSHIIVGDYSEAFTVYKTIDHNMIKWDLWQFPSAPRCIIGDRDSTTKVSVLNIAMAAGNIYSLKDGETNDYGNAIQSYWKSAFKSAVSGWIHHYSGIKFSAWGSGDIDITLYGKDDEHNASIPLISIVNQPGREYQTPINYESEEMAVKFSVDGINERYTFKAFMLWCRPIWSQRPG